MKLLRNHTEKCGLSRKQIPLSKNEGIYVQDTQSGKVESQIIKLWKEGVL